MDPYVATIVKQTGAIAVGIAAVGVVVALVYGLYQYAQLQHALTLNMMPPGLP